MHILRLRAWRLSLLATLFLITLAPATFAQNRSVYAIRDARIYPVSGPLIEQGTVVIRDGLIEAVGASVRIPPEATVLDGSGLTVYPGPDGPVLGGPGGTFEAWHAVAHRVQIRMP